MSIWSLRLLVKKPVLVWEEIDSIKTGKQYKIEQDEYTYKLINLLEKIEKSKEPKVQSFLSKEKEIFLICFQHGEESD